MATTVHFEKERLELDALLASGIFSRAPRLAQLLVYLCTRYFDGEADRIKEYNIAVEALGRPPEFDQKRDSIVRVEIHHLRRRLRAYYASAGESHPIHIEIPIGRYAPHFVLRKPSAEAVLDIAEQLEDPPKITGTVAGAAATPPWRHQPWLTLGTVALLCGAFAVFFLASREGRPTAARTADQPAATLPGGGVRILAGSQDDGYVDAFGHAWQSDRYFHGGGGVFRSSGQVIWGTRTPALYQSRREGEFSYDIPLPPGTYELRLHFAETLYGDNNLAGGGETSRLFHVRVNGRDVLREFDVIADSCARCADVRVFKDVSPAPDGRLHIEFVRMTGAPFLNAIEVTPGVPGRLLPVRLVAQERPYKDSSGSVWLPDRYSRGGQTVSREGDVARTDTPNLFYGERFGNFAYEIPATPGRYRLTLYFAERWFGPDKPGGGGVGSRVFSVVANAESLLKNLDIFKEAGGSDRALVRSFRNIEPNPQGKIVVTFVPSRNYAAINALEIDDESKP